MKKALLFVCYTYAAATAGCFLGIWVTAKAANTPAEERDRGEKLYACWADQMGQPLD